MGSGASARKNNRLFNLNSALEEDHKKENEKRIIKLLLLGAAECGKSTVLKQMKLLHDKCFSEAEQKLTIPVIYSNVLQSIITLVNAMDQLQLKFADDKRRDDARLVQQIVNTGHDHEPLTFDTYLAVKRLWSDTGILHCFERTGEYQLSDSAQYFLDNLDRIVVPEYQPTEQDILRARVRTIGIVEVHFTFKNKSFRVFDMGGQRSERRKWIHYFDSVKAILFIIALSEYDQKLMEDGKTNRMLESLVLFDSIINCQWFKKTNIILFLNKKDLFETKIERVPITVAFADYHGPQTYEDSLCFIEVKFKTVNRTQLRVIYPHRTCGTDTKQIQFVLDSTINSLIEYNLKDAGLY